MAKALRIFISSPGDVAPERRRAALVIEKLAKDYARFFEIEPYLWETEPMLASGHFQDAIVQPGETDILVLILWARLGTPLPEQKYRGIDGRVPVTGTEWEFEAALAAHKQRGVPDLLAYRKKASPKAEYTSDADLEELRTQLQKFDVFWSRHFVDQGEFRAAFGEFADLDAFEAKLEGDLRRLIERRISALSGDKAVSPTWLKGSPFRGLETYHFEHAPIFFGRSEATKTAVEHLVENAEAGRPFLLVLGASGAGKSSLAQAGIVPALGVRGVVAGVGEWRRAVIRPGGHPGGPFLALAAGIVGEEALPEILEGQDIAALARHLEAASADPGFPIVTALTARERAARQNGDLLSFEEVRLILVADQLEELFTLGEVTPDQRKAFILCLKGLMDSRRVFVVATMRSDYWHRAAEVPLLVALAEGDGRLDLLPATQAEITEMIRRPAEVAGLSFETDPRTEIRLDAALAEEASREPGALPLLSFLLDALYAKDVQESQGSTLRYATMRLLGGLRGAIANRAEAAFAALPVDAQAALPKVLRALVTVSRSGAEPTARAVPMARFVEGSPERHLVEAFLDPQVRLLVADGDGEGARVRLAHEALITHWTRARDQLITDRRDLETRTVVERQLTRWNEARGRARRHLLLRNPDLANAIDLEKRWGDELDTSTCDFIKQSGRRARLAQTLTAAAAVLFALVGGVAFYAAQQALRATSEAEFQRVNVLAELGASERLRGNWDTALRLNVHAARLDLRLDPRTITTARARAVLATTVWESNWQILFAGHEGAVKSAAFSPDGSRIVTASYDKTARIWDAANGKEVVALRGHADRINSAAFSPDGSRIVTASDDKTARIWDLTGKVIAVLRFTTRVNSATFSPDGSVIVTASGFGNWDPNTVRIWNAASGRELAVLRGGDWEMNSVAFSPDGTRIIAASINNTALIWDTATGKKIAVINGIMVTSAAFSHDGSHVITALKDGTARIWETATGHQVAILPAHDGFVLSAAFSLEGSRIVTVSSDGTSRIWDAATAKEIAVLHGPSVNSAAFSPDGSHIVTGSNDNTARIWDPAPVKETAVFRGHEGAVKSAAFSPDGSRIVTASDDKTARIWDAASGKEVVALRGHAHRINSAAFSPDGSRIVTASGDKTARIWDAATGKVISVLPCEGYVNSAAFSPDASRIITASGDDMAARIWDAATGKEIAVFRGPEVSPAALGGRLSPDGSQIIWESSDLIGAYSYAAFSSDGTRIVAALKDRNVHVLDAAGKEIEILSGHERMVHFVAFSPDGSRIVTASSDGTARVWNAATGREIAVLRGPKGAVKSAAYSPDGSRIVTASPDSAAHIWDAATGMEVGLVRTDGLESVEFSPDGSHIVTASDDKTARIWDVRIATLSAKELIVESCLRRLRGVTTLSRDEMRLAGYGDSTREIDVCAGIE